MRRVVYAAVAVFGVAIMTAAVRNDFGLGRNIELLVNLFRELDVFYVDSLDVDDVMQRAADGMVSGLDPYTEYLSEKEMSQFMVMSTGKYGGVGSLIRKKGDYVVFVEPYRGYPADRAGIRIGDLLLEIDGESAKDLSVEEVSDRLKGDPGTTVRLKVRKLIGGDDVDLTLVRERVSLPGVPYSGWVTDSIAYISHSDFTEGCGDEMRNAVMRFKESGRLRGLILDYRNNGGGVVQEAVDILSMFLPKGTEVLELKGRQPSSNMTYVTEKEPIDTSLPIVVLTNSGTASAAEIVSGALQDMDRAVLLGRRTFGKGLVQETRPLGFNSYLKVTTAKYYMPSGRCIQAIDYAHRNEDGSVGYVPDSLIREFRTAGGRKVYDGGGIMPDIVTEAEYASHFAMLVYALGYIDDFADDYVRKNDARLQGLDPKSFSITDEDYAAFMDFMEDKEVDYRSQTRVYLDRLRDAAEQELYDSTFISQIERMGGQLKDDKRSNLERYRDELTDAINGRIIMSYAYSDGVAEYNMQRDADLDRAIEVLNDPAEYRRILTEQDTRRTVEAEPENEE